MQATRAATIATAPVPAAASESGSTPVLSPHEMSSAVKVVGGAAENDAEPEADAAMAAAPSIEDGPTVVDEAAESAFLAEARARGEVPSKSSAAVGPVEEVDARPLPKLDDLVNRIPADVREVLEDLFRARFVSVKRIPKKSLTS